MNPIVIFGVSEFAEVAHFYFTHDSPREVAAFTVDGIFFKEGRFSSLPVVAFEDIEGAFPAQSYDLFVAVGYKKLNSVRATKCAEARKKGYFLQSYVSSKATTWPGLNHGDNCFFLEDNTIQPFVNIGNNVTLWSGNHIGHHAQIADNCFITSHVVISGSVKVGENSFIGVNATVRDHVNIASHCVIGAGAVIVKDTQEGGVYIGQAAERSSVPSHRLRKL